METRLEPGYKSHVSRNTVDMQNAELIAFLRSGKLDRSSRSVSDESQTVKAAKKRKTVDRAALGKIRPSKTLSDIVKANKAFKSTTKRADKPGTVQKTYAPVVTVEKVDCKHYCQSFKQNVQMFHKFADAERFTKELKKKLRRDPTAHNRVADVLKKHAFHNINLLNDLKRI